MLNILYINIYNDLMLLYALYLDRGIRQDEKLTVYLYQQITSN